LGKRTELATPSAMTSEFVMVSGTATIHDATVARYALGVDRKATPQQVWRALTDDISTWWPAPLY